MAYDPSRDTCATCLAYVADQPDQGECHFNPPVHTPRDNGWAFPGVTADNTCFRHIPIFPDHDQKTCH